MPLGISVPFWLIAANFMAMGVWQQWLWDNLSMLLLPAFPAHSTECRAGSWAAANSVKLPINQVFHKSVSDWFHNVIKIIKGKHFKCSIIYTNHLYFLSTFPHFNPLTLWDSCHALEDVSFLTSALIAAEHSGNEEKYCMTGDCAGDKKCNAIYYKIVYAACALCPSKIKTICKVLLQNLVYIPVCFLWFLFFRKQFSNAFSVRFFHAGFSF